MIEALLQVFSQNTEMARLRISPFWNAYRKMNEPWNIDDFHQVGLSYKRFRDSRIRWHQYVDEATCWNQYRKWYLHK